MQSKIDVTVRHRGDAGAGDAALYICLTLLFLFCWGEPDLLSALIGWLVANS